MQAYLVRDNWVVASSTAGSTTRAAACTWYLLLRTRRSEILSGSRSSTKEVCMSEQRNAMLAHMPLPLRHLLPEGRWIYEVCWLRPRMRRLCLPVRGGVQAGKESRNLNWLGFGRSVSHRIFSPCFHNITIGSWRFCPSPTVGVPHLRLYLKHVSMKFEANLGEAPKLMCMY